MTMNKYKQNLEVPWLKTPVGTIWEETGIDSYIQPVDKSLIQSMFGVDLDLLSDEDLELFKKI